MNCHFSLFAGLIAGILFTLFEGVLGIDDIEGYKESTNQSLNRAWGHSPAFINGKTLGSVVPIASFRGVGGGGRSGGRGGRRGGGIDGGFTTPKKNRPRVFSMLQGSVGIDCIEGSKVSASQSLNRTWGHSPVFIHGKPLGSVVPIESLRGVGGSGRGGRRGGRGGRGTDGGFKTPKRNRPRAFSSNNNSALKSPFVNLGLLVFLLFCTIFFNNTS
ncbi:hypothetical protein SUGI_0488850 [Cryptomeria japonica]|uniref:uncharacterized protein LOC131058321 n=1 Tax=Cryptomeria japonica TaxID=3369 RepID=UPI002408C11D|nr:uncharacterized protein LOC131058321 [Cryptomeria japonica]GLJ25529.1 hypothetical protein SUGI_0488850 [Cryptomeria japonica]